jgi:hypothetical protein
LVCCAAVRSIARGARVRQRARDRLKLKRLGANMEAEADARRAFLDGAVDGFNVPALVAIAGGLGTQ